MPFNLQQKALKEEQDQSDIPLLRSPQSMQSQEDQEEDDKLWEDWKMRLENSSRSQTSSSRRFLASVLSKLSSISWWREQPVFLFAVLIVQAFLCAYSIYLNGGFAPWPYVNPFLGPSAEVLVALGARDVKLILAGQWWRFFTPIFLHVGILHLLFNMVFQIRSGLPIERGIGSVKFAFVYLLAGIGGNLASAIFLPSFLSVGASGGCFGIIGLSFASFAKNWSVIERPCLGISMLFVTVVINLGLGLLPLVDNFCHMGGLITGLLAACFVLPSVYVPAAPSSAPADEDAKRPLLTFMHDNEQEEDQPPKASLPPEPLLLRTYTSVKNLSFAIFGALVLCCLFFVGFYVFYAHVRVDKWCSVCYDLSCVEFWEICKQQLNGT